MCWKGIGMGLKPFNDLGTPITHQRSCEATDSDLRKHLRILRIRKAQRKLLLQRGCVHVCLLLKIIALLLSYSSSHLSDSVSLSSPWEFFGRRRLDPSSPHLVRLRSCVWVQTCTYFAWLLSTSNCARTSTWFLRVIKRWKNIWDTVEYK